MRKLTIKDFEETFRNRRPKSMVFIDIIRF